jgi:hypothetical protein
MSKPFDKVAMENVNSPGRVVRVCANTRPASFSMIDHSPGLPWLAVANSKSSSPFNVSNVMAYRWRFQRRVRIQNPHLAAAKVSNPVFRAKIRKFRRHFKGVFWNGNMEVRILPGQPTSPATGDCAVINRINARQLRAFANKRPVSRLPIHPTLRRNCR